jgi:queuine tRNA-ribosyltransferase
MYAAGFQFQVKHVDADTAARRSALTTPHGPVELPAFMPVGTQGTVKGLAVEQIAATGAQMVLANAYHLALRPGAEPVSDLGGLHEFMGWQGPILTDSGGFQIFSLAQMTSVTEDGATFRSHIDGSQVFISPERAIQIQQLLGPDVAMALDHVVRLPNDPETIVDANDRTIRWAARCREVKPRAGQALFGIVQGGLDPVARTHCAEALSKMDFDGYAVGGLSVGESHEEMVAALRCTVPALPQDRPRYLMGVGRPEDLLAAIGHGIDLFDCVMPTRNGRNALAFTDNGRLRLRNACHAKDQRPLESDCPCAACRHSRAYLRHLFVGGEMLGPVLLSIHNLTYYQRLLAGARQAIENGQFEQFSRDKLARWSAESQDFTGGNESTE